MKLRPDPYTISRRQMLKYSAGSALALAVGSGCGDDGGSTPPTTGPDAGACMVIPEQITGPFYVNTGDVRRDVTEGITGAVMVVRTVLVDARTCQPLVGIPVDIWQTTPSGLYSGVDNSIVLPDGPNTEGETYMRGRQITDSSGEVVFETLYPGWYQVVAPHIHLTSTFGTDQGFTWQYYLDDDFSEQVYTTVSEYVDRGLHPVRTEDQQGTNADLIVRPSGTPDNSEISTVVAIDMDNLSPAACEYGDQSCQEPLPLYKSRRR